MSSGGEVFARPQNERVHEQPAVGLGGGADAEQRAA